MLVIRFAKHDSSSRSTEGRFDWKAALWTKKTLRPLGRVAFDTALTGIVGAGLGAGGSYVYHRFHNRDKEQMYQAMRNRARSVGVGTAYLCAVDHGLKPTGVENRYVRGALAGCSSMLLINLPSLRVGGSPREQLFDAWTSCAIGALGIVAARSLSLNQT